MKWLVCGGRDQDPTFCSYALNELVVIGLPDLVIHGNARGADRAAKEWAESIGIHTAGVDALWDYHQKAAGPYRNSAMLLLLPDLCVALPGDTGTQDMVEQSLQQEIPVIRYENDEWVAYLNDQSFYFNYWVDILSDHFTIDVIHAHLCN